MEALLCHKLGDPALPTSDPSSPIAVSASHPVPALASPTSVRVRVRATSLNYANYLQILGKYQEKPPLPFIPGSDYSGVVDAVGDAVSSFKVGDRVCSLAPLGSFAEFIVADEKDLLMEDSYWAKPFTFDGRNFRRWQNQMRFWLTTLGLVSAVSDPVENGNETAPDGAIQNVVNRPQTRSQSQNAPTPPAVAPATVPPSDRSMINYYCLNRILSTLSDKLYDIYSSIQTARELWISLEQKYGQIDPTKKRYQASDLLKFKLVDSKPMSDQLQDFEYIIEQLRSSGVDLDESFLVATLIDKLPLSWSNHANDLNHNQRELSLNFVLRSISIEETNRARDKKPSEPTTQVNLVENPKPKGRNFQPFRNLKKKPFHPKKFNPNFKKPRPDGSGVNSGCFVCGKTNHFAKDCFYRKNRPYAPKKKKGAPP